MPDRDGSSDGSLPEADKILPKVDHSQKAAGVTEELSGGCLIATVAAMVAPEADKISRKLITRKKLLAQRKNFREDA